MARARGKTSPTRRALSSASTSPASGRGKGEQDARDLPDGQINDTSAIFVSSPPRKNIPLRASGKSNLQLPPSDPTEGRIAIVTDAGLDAMDAAASAHLRGRMAPKRTVKSCGPDVSTPASSWRKYPPMTVTRKPDHRGEHEGNR